jgi:hypothetical protein
MNFQDVFVNALERFSIGVEQETGRRYVSIPVSNGVVDYEEYFEIDEVQFHRYQRDPSSALEFVRRCRARELDDLLMVKPGRDRGVAT